MPGADAKRGDGSRHRHVPAPAAAVGWHVALVVAAVLAVYANALPNAFLWDDRMLVVGNQTTQVVAGNTVPADLAVFRIRGDGMLEFAQRYDLAIGRKPLWWTGLVPLR